MRMRRLLALLSSLFVLPLLLNVYVIGKDTKKKIKNDVCSASNPVSIVPRRTPAVPRLPLAPSIFVGARNPQRLLLQLSPAPSPTNPFASKLEPPSPFRAPQKTRASSLISAPPILLTTKALSWAVPIGPSP